MEFDQKNHKNHKKSWADHYMHKSNRWTRG